MSSIVNKIKDAVSSDHKTSSHQHGVPEGTHGTHNSRVVNAADPRIDSDLDGSQNMGAARRVGDERYGGVGGVNNDYSAGTTGTTGMTGMNDSRLRTEQGTGYGAREGVGYGARDETGYGAREGIAGAGARTGNTYETGAYETSPRAGGLGAGSGVTGMTGTHGAPTGTHGPHNSRVANAADPRIDSDRDGRAALGSAAPGPAPNTAGPHKNDMLNKVDPRVDSDMDGSKTFGGNKTYQ